MGRKEEEKGEERGENKKRRGKRRGKGGGENGPGFIGHRCRKVGDNMQEDGRKITGNKGVSWL